MRNDYDLDIENCPIADIQKVIHGKQTMVMVYFLSHGTLRFGEFSPKLPQVTQANLTKELRLLEEYGLIHGEVYREVPPKMKYWLTDIGKEFLSVLEALEVWVNKYATEK